MSDTRKDLMRASAKIREQLLTPASRAVAIELPDCLWSDCLASGRMLQIVSGRGWQAAAHDIQRRLVVDIRALQTSLQELLREIETPSVPLIASQREIFEDLLALEDEFEGLCVDLKQQELSVTTVPITLEGVHLGSFQIVLRWTGLGGPLPYRIVATDSEYGASSRDDTPHPHVDGESLCEGEAKFPIRQALKQGRLFDFFTIVRQTLLTYNSSSAYVQLPDWSGIRCGCCDDVVHEDDRYSCERCGTSVCSDCYRRCDDCDCYLCGECGNTCPACDQTCCNTCLSPCRKCDNQFCKECLTDGQCDSCREADDETEQLETAVSATTSTPTGAPVHAHGVRQAALPARRRRH